MIIAISITLFFIVLRFTVTLFNFISNPKLTRVNRHYSDMVSILIPARNEEDNILLLLESIYRQDYISYEVIVYDDDSTDNTYEVCLDFAARHAHFSVIKGGRPPDGWVGKNYGCCQLAAVAKGSYFLFLDADELISNNLVNSALHRMHIYRLGLLSLSPNPCAPGPGTNTVVPLLHYMLLNLLPLRLVYLVKSPAVAAAFGQFMLFEATAYRQNQWHEQIGDKLTDGTEIMKLVKAKRYNAEILLPNGMVGNLNYKSYKDAINGYSKNFLAAFNYSVPGVLVYIMLIIGGPMIVIMTLNFNLMFFMAALIILTRIMISLSSGQNAFYNLLLHPIQMVNLAVIGFLSVQRYLTKTVVWKGRRV